MDLRHEVEVHAPESYQESQRDEDRAHHRQHADDFVGLPLLLGVVVFLQVLEDHAGVLDAVGRADGVVVKVAQEHVQGRREERVLVVLEDADHVLERLGEAAEAHDDALEAVDLVEVPVIGALEDGILELGGGVFDLFGLVEQPVDQRVQERVDEVTGVPLADVAFVVGDALLDGLEDLLVVLVEGDDPVLGGDDGDLLAARGVFLDADADGAGDGEELVAVFLELRTGRGRQDVFLGQHGDVEERPHDVDDLRVGDAEDLDPDHALLAGVAADGVQVGELLHLAAGFVVGDDPELGRDGRFEGGGGRQLARGAADLGVLVGGFPGQGGGVRLQAKAGAQVVHAPFQEGTRPSDLLLAPLLMPAHPAIIRRPGGLSTGSAGAPATGLSPSAGLWRYGDRSCRCRG